MPNSYGPGGLRDFRTTYHYDRCAENDGCRVATVIVNQGTRDRRAGERSESNEKYGLPQIDSELLWSVQKISISDFDTRVLRTLLGWSAVYASVEIMSAITIPLAAPKSTANTMRPAVDLMASQLNSSMAAQ